MAETNAYVDDNLLRCPEEIWLHISVQCLKVAGHIGVLMARLVCKDWARIFESGYKIEDLFSEIASTKSEQIRHFFKQYTSDFFTKNEAIFAAVRQSWISLANDNDKASAIYFASEARPVSSVVSCLDRFYVVGRANSGKSTLIQCLCRRLAETPLWCGMPCFSEHQWLHHIDDFTGTKLIPFISGLRYTNMIAGRIKGDCYVVLSDTLDPEAVTSIYRQMYKTLSKYIDIERMNKIDDMMHHKANVKPGCYKNWLLVSLLYDIQVWISPNLTQEEQRLFLPVNDDLGSGKPAFSDGRRRAIDYDIAYEIEQAGRSDVDEIRSSTSDDDLTRALAFDFSTESDSEDEEVPWQIPRT